MASTSKLSATQQSLLHVLCTSKDGTGTWDSRHRAALRALERRGFVVITESYDPCCRAKSVPLYTAAVTSSGRALFALLER